MFNPEFPSIPVTRRECATLLEERLAALRDAVERDRLLPAETPQDRAGYKAFMRLHDRARDGSLIATIVIERPGHRQRYRRSLRVVTGEPRGAERPVYLRGAAK